MADRPPTPTRKPGRETVTGRGDASRRTAGSILRNVVERKLALDDAVALALRSQSDLAQRDRALARAIAFVSLKHLGTLRFVLNRHLRRPLDDLPPDAAAALVTGAAQLLYMAVPDHAAVDAAVNWIKDRTRSETIAGVANAVLRRISAERTAAQAAAHPAGDPLRALPLWIARSWRDSYGEARARAMAAAVTREPTLDVTLLGAAAGAADDWAARLDGQVLPHGTIRLNSLVPVHELPGYDAGVWQIQDAAAAIPARLLAARADDVIYDLCAAPGGKTAQLAATGATVTALDRSAARLARLRDNLDRLHLSAKIVTADAATWQAPPADAILLDAPCSGTGTIRRHPDIAWTKTAQDVASLAALQARLLDNAVRLLRPGGRLVFSTCSLEPAEGEALIAPCLARHPDIRIDPVSPAEIPGLEGAIDASGAVRTTPEMWPADEARQAGLDGFYAVRLIRRA